MIITEHINGVVVTAEDGKVTLMLPTQMTDPDIKNWKQENCKKLKELKDKSKLNEQ